MYRTGVSPSGLAASTPLFPLAGSSLSFPVKPTTIQFGPIGPVTKSPSSGITSPRRPSSGSFGSINSSSGLSSPRSVASLSSYNSLTLPTQPLFTGTTSPELPRSENIGLINPIIPTYAVPASPTKFSNLGNMIVNSSNQTNEQLTPIEGYYNIPSGFSTQTGVKVSVPPINSTLPLNTRVMSPTRTRYVSPTRGDRTKLTYPVVLPGGLSGTTMGTYQRGSIRSPSRSVVLTSADRSWRHGDMPWFEPVKSDRADFSYKVRVYDPINKTDFVVYFGDAKISSAFGSRRAASPLSTGYQRTSPGVMARDDPLTAIFWERRFIAKSGEPYEVSVPEGLTISQLPNNFKIKTIVYA